MPINEQLHEARYNLKLWLIALICLSIFMLAIPIGIVSENSFSVIMMFSIQFILITVCIISRKYKTAIVMSFVLLAITIVLDASLIKVAKKSQIVHEFVSTSIDLHNDTSQENLKKVKLFREKGLGIASSTLFIISVRNNNKISAAETVSYGVKHHTGQDLYLLSDVVNKSIRAGEFDKSTISSADYNIIQRSLGQNSYLRLIGQLAPNVEDVLESIKHHAWQKY